LNYFKNSSEKQSFHIDIENLLWISGQGAFWKDINSHYLGCNDIAAEKSQIKSRKEIMGRTDFDIPTLSAYEATQIREGDQLVINTQRPHCFLYSASNGAEKNVFVTYKAPLFNSNKLVVGVYGIDSFIDIHNETAYLSTLEKAGIPIQDLRKLKSKIFPQNSLRQNKTLTQRQYDCLYYLSRGMTIKRIAQELKLSARTVEHYLEHVKNKFSCSTRTEIIELFLAKLNHF
jgi:DNA-binding CsgD family transcriptional regulator